MQPVTTLQLGDFTFSAFEVPEQIAFGGSQRLAVHELVGGVKVVDAMGRSERQLEWSGWLLGSGQMVAGGPKVFDSALDRARQLDALRIAGKPVPLKWSEFNYSVLVREFEATFQRVYKLPYRIVCEVVADLTAPGAHSVAAPIDQAVADDAATATDAANAVGDSTLSDLMTTLC